MRACPFLVQEFEPRLRQQSAWRAAGRFRGSGSRQRLLPRASAAALAFAAAAALALASALAFSGEARVDFGGFGGMDLVVVLVRFGEFVAIEQQAAEAVVGGELELDVHLDGVERADLDADLAAHADGDIDVEAAG